MKNQINNLKKYIKQMEQEKFEAECTAGQRQLDIDAASYELKTLEQNALVVQRKQMLNYPENNYEHLIP
jgi:7,8-dihydro-6-hydroxymethylpterin-pyrophosphokinase